MSPLDVMMMIDNIDCSNDDVRKVINDYCHKAENELFDTEESLMQQYLSVEQTKVLMDEGVSKLNIWFACYIMFQMKSVWNEYVYIASHEGSWVLYKRHTR